MSKLNEATTLVDELKRKAAEQSALLAQKQTEADEALKEITVSMQVICMCVHISCCSDYNHSCVVFECSMYSVCIQYNTFTYIPINPLSSKPVSRKQKLRK